MDPRKTKAFAHGNRSEARARMGRSELTNEPVWGMSVSLEATLVVYHEDGRRCEFAFSEPRRSVGAGRGLKKTYSN